MLTTVILDGAMGKKFGRRWRLAVDSPNEALRMIDANKPGVFVWIRDNLARYANYKVTCKYEDGRVEELDENEYPLNRKATEIRFTPILEGSGAVGRIIAGIVLVIVGILLVWSVGLPIILAGIGLIVGGVIQLLTPQPKMGAQNPDSQKRSDGTSYYFDGPVNTVAQGATIQLIYGECLVGSHPIYAAVTVDDVKKKTGSTNAGGIDPLIVPVETLNADFDISPLVIAPGA